jgi:hypothetical protein
LLLICTQFAPYLPVFAATAKTSMQITANGVQITANGVQITANKCLNFFTLQYTVAANHGKVGANHGRKEPKSGDAVHTCTVVFHAQKSHPSSKRYPNERSRRAQEELPVEGQIRSAKSADVDSARDDNGERRIPGERTYEEEDKQEEQLSENQERQQPKWQTRQ